MIANILPDPAVEREKLLKAARAHLVCALGFTVKACEPSLGRLLKVAIASVERRLGRPTVSVDFIDSDAVISRLRQIALEDDGLSAPAKWLADWLEGAR